LEVKEKVGRTKEIRGTGNQDVGIRKAGYQRGWSRKGWGGGDGKYHPGILRRLSECRGNKSRRGNNEDALIIKVCKMNMMTLVTNDKAAQRVSGDLGVSWVRVDAFLAGMGR
jgi:hypothetical protein